jgi:hypothetical protein
MFLFMGACMHASARARVSDKDSFSWVLRVCVSSMLIDARAKVRPVLIHRSGRASGCHYSTNFHLRGTREYFFE